MEAWTSTLFYAVESYVNVLCCVDFCVVKNPQSYRAKVIQVCLLLNNSVNYLCGRF